MQCRHYIHIYTYIIHIHTHIRNTDTIYTHAIQAQNTQYTRVFVAGNITHKSQYRHTIQYTNNTDTFAFLAENHHKTQFCI